ncbi:hypothetical protein KL928_001986 [Ogataea angusta]|uniref:Uncharacterized protein n=1 Tax=Pichia angusta TaxID=870730 RepID=A0AAN6DGT2_PICAN|nr:uncharacterized protein KL928_001986 [Ogataea angusta]KAG7819312.1 hypothetical protein KL928_001986 [Ogataea angusta]
MEVYGETAEIAQRYVRWLNYVVINFGSQIVIYGTNLKPVKKLLIPDTNLYHMVVIERYLLLIVDIVREPSTIVLTWDKEHIEIAHCGHDIKKHKNRFQDGGKSLFDGYMTGWMLVHAQTTLYRIYLNARKINFQPYADDGVLELGPDFFSQIQRNVLLMYVVHHKTLCLPWVHRKTAILEEQLITCSNGFDSRFYKLSSSNSRLLGLARTHDGNIRKIIPIGERHLLIVSKKIRVVLSSSACNKYGALGCDEGLEIYCSNDNILDVLFIREGHAIICDQKKGLLLLSYKVKKSDFNYKLKFVGEYIKARQVLKLNNHKYLAISRSNVILFQFTKRSRLEVQGILREQSFVPVTNLLTESKAVNSSSKNCTSIFVEAFQDDTTHLTSIKMRSKLKIEQTKIPVLASMCEIYPIDVNHLLSRCLDGYLHDLILKGDTVIFKSHPVKITELENVIGVGANVMVTTKCAIQVSTNNVLSTFMGNALSYEFTSSYGVILTSSMLYIFMLQPNPHVIHKVACSSTHISIYESSDKDLRILYDVHGILHYLKVNCANMIYVRSGTGQADTQDLMLLNNDIFASLTSCGTLYFKKLNTFDDVSMIKLHDSCSRVRRINDISFAAFSPLGTFVYLMTANIVESHFIQNTKGTLQFQVIGTSLYHLRKSELVISTIVPNFSSENVFHHLGPMYNTQFITIEQSHYLIYNDYEKAHLYDLSSEGSFASLDMPSIQNMYFYEGLKIGENLVADRCLVLLVAEVNELFDTSKCTLELVAVRVSQDPSLEKLFSVKPKYSNWSCLDWNQLREVLDARSDHQLQIQAIPGSWTICGNGRCC